MPRLLAVSSRSSSSSQASIGAVVGCDRVLSGGVRDAVGFENFSIEQSDLRIPLKKSTFSTGCADGLSLIHI